MKKLFEINPKQKLSVIADITCDIDGSIQLTTKATPSENPVYVYNPLTGKTKDGVEGVGTVILAQDNLPSELSKSASRFFGNKLSSFIPQLAKADYTKSLVELDIPEVFKKAVIAHQGELNKSYQYLREHLVELK